MPVPAKYLADFYEDGIYHVYNRTSNRQPLFNNHENRLYFLKQYAKYLQPVLHTYCWNLLPNHFHFLVRVKSESEIVKAVSSKGFIDGKGMEGLEGKEGKEGKEGIQPLKGWIPSLPSIPSDEAEPLLQGLSKTERRFINKEISVNHLVGYYFKSFFQSYSLSFNKENNKTGNLFYKPFKRIEVIKETHFTKAMIYIHANAQKHQLCKHFTQHRWSSWHTMLSAHPTNLCRQEILDWFGGLQPFIDAHFGMSKYYYDNEVSIEDD